MALPAFAESGDLPPGIHRATWQETLDRFGAASARRKVLSLRLQRIWQLASSTGHLKQFVVFGSFFTAKAEPNDVDVFLLMEDAFDASQLTGETRMLFDHAAAQAHFGASVFWLRRLAAFGGEQQAIEDWQVKRDGGKRGIVKIVREAP